MICKACGGKRTKEHCNLCELFGTGFSNGEVQTSKCWPMVSKAGLACDPTQVAEMNARNEHHGVSARYNDRGHCIIDSPGDRRKLLKLEGVVDKDAFI